MVRDPNEEVKRFRREMDNLFDKFFGPEAREKVLSKFLTDFREPLCDIIETDKDLITHIELPGIDKKDIQLNVKENHLEIKVNKKSEYKAAGKDFVKAERSYRGFYRSIVLPSSIVPDRSKAKYKDGILEIVMPKSEKKDVKSRKLNIE